MNLTNANPVEEGSIKDVDLDSRFHENAWYTELGTIALMILGGL